MNAFDGILNKSKIVALSTIHQLQMGIFRDGVNYNYIIHPVAIEYRYSEDTWLGGNSFARHFYSRFGRKNLELRVSFGPSLTDTDEV